jgi:hypothetical protein
MTELRKEKEKEEAKNGEAPNFYFMMDDVQRTNNNQTCVPDDDELKRDILEESYHTWYTGHPGGTKMYQDMKTKY